MLRKSLSSPVVLRSIFALSVAACGGAVEGPPSTPDPTPANNGNGSSTETETETKPAPTTPAPTTPAPTSTTFRARYVASSYDMPESDVCVQGRSTPILAAAAVSGLAVSGGLTVGKVTRYFDVPAAPHWLVPFGTSCETAPANAWTPTPAPGRPYTIVLSKNATFRAFEDVESNDGFGARVRTLNFFESNSGAPSGDAITASVASFGSSEVASSYVPYGENVTVGPEGQLTPLGFVQLGKSTFEEVSVATDPLLTDAIHLEGSIDLAGTSPRAIGTIFLVGTPIFQDTPPNNVVNSRPPRAIVCADVAPAADAFATCTTFKNSWEP